MKKMALLTLWCLCLAAAGREWTDIEERKVTAEFVRLDGDEVVVKRADGREVRLNRAILAKGEWEAAEELQKGAEKAHVLEPLELSAKTSSMGREEVKTWETSWGSFNKTIDQSRVVEVTVRSRSAVPRKAMVEVIWLSAGSDGKGGPSGIAGVSRFSIELEPREIKVGKVPQSYSREHDRYRALGLTFRSGNSFAGWVARVSDPDTGTVFQTVGSRPPLTIWAERVPVLPYKN